MFEEHKSARVFNLYFKFVVNHLTLKIDTHLISPYNITLESHTKVRRIKETINN